MLNQPQCQSMLGPYERLLAAIPENAYNCYITDYAHVSVDHSPTARAIIIQNHMVALAKRMLPEEFYPLPNGRRKFFDFGGKLMIQFKKLDPQLRTRNFPTQTALSILDNDSIASLPGIPATLPIVTVGYVPNADWSDIAGCYVTYTRYRQLEWAYPITGGGANVIEFPQTSPNTPQTPHSYENRLAKRRIKKPGRDDSGTEQSAG